MSFLGRAPRKGRIRDLLGVVVFTIAGAGAAYTPVCHEYGSVKACLVNHMLCEGVPIRSDWEYNQVIDASYWSNTTDDPGNLAVSTGRGRLTLSKRDLLDRGESTHQQQTRVDNATVPVLILWRDLSNMLHWTKNQLFPAALLLREFGLDAGPFQLIAINGPGYQGSLRKASGLIDKQWEIISGHKPIEMEPGSSLYLYARTAIIGQAGQITVGENDFLPLQSVLEQREAVKWFAHWCLSRFAIQHKHQPLDIRDMQLTVNDRSHLDLKRLTNFDQVLSTLRYQFPNVKRAPFETMAFEQQLSIMASTDVYFAVHGAALTHLLFLPRWAVVIEVQAIGHGTRTRDFVAGYCNLARMSSISYILWHNQDRTSTTAGPHGWDDFKNHETFLSNSTVQMLASQAYQTLQTPLAERDLDSCLELNLAVDPGEELSDRTE